jgi:hypothetical protein
MAAQWSRSSSRCPTADDRAAAVLPAG